MMNVSKEVREDEVSEIEPLMANTSHSEQQCIGYYLTVLKKNIVGYIDNS